MAVMAVLFVGFWVGVFYVGYRVLKAIRKRRKQITTWTVEGDGTKRAKRDILRYQELEALAKLHNDGVIDDDEFEKRKRVALGEDAQKRSGNVVQNETKSDVIGDSDRTSADHQRHAIPASVRNVAN